MGLSIVQDVAARHGGRAWIESDAGAGAAFVIALPVPDMSSPTRERAAAPLVTGERPVVG